MSQPENQRFNVTYKITTPEGSQQSARERAETICIEQTIEFPSDLVTQPHIREHVFGRIESVAQDGKLPAGVVISYAADCAGDDLDQLLNVIYGNISLHAGIRVQQVDLPTGMLERFNGPNFGQAGLRRLLDAPRRPLLCTACKPMGLSPQQLARQAYQYALGAIDIIKDDHGLANQPFAPFQERVAACVKAVEKANRETGGNTRYFPNITAGSKTAQRAKIAADLGAGGFLVSPGLCGLDTMRCVADTFALPILAHPALQGSYVVSPQQGISHFALFGQLNRLAGADAVIFPHFGGRFAFTAQDCRQLSAGTRTPMGNLAPIFPVPAGGMTLEKVPGIVDFYGPDIILLIGGDLHRGDLVTNCRTFRKLVDG